MTPRRLFLAAAALMHMLPMTAIAQSPAAPAKGPPLQYTVMVEDFKPEERKITVKYLEKREVMPGMFAPAGLVAEIGYDGNVTAPKSLNKGDLVRLAHARVGDFVVLKSVTLVKAAGR